MQTSPYPLNSIGRFGIYATVFTTGASVMVIELLGTRLIAPFYGTSLYVWSSLISVTLMALAIGYFTGGRWADRSCGKGLSIIITLAGLLIVLIPGLSRPILLATDDALGFRAGAFVSALALFLPGLTLLGMISPFAIKLATRQIQGIGSTSGAIYGVSTVGSVLGTLLLGFFLFPRLGTHEILLGTGAALMALGLLVAFYEKYYLSSNRVVLWVTAFCVLGVFLSPLLATASQNPSRDTNYTIRSEQESLYGWVRVIDNPKRNLRFLTSDASMIGAASLSSGQNLLTYQNIVGLLPSLVPGMKRALIVGQGAGHMAMALHERYGIQVDTIEIDPAVAQAAIEFFDFKPSGKAKVGDARYEIRHLTGPYDLIIHDCFTGGTEPAHLLTVETFTEMSRLLSKRGLLAVNFVGFFDHGSNIALASVAKTLDHVFTHHVAFISEPGDDFNDFIFLAGHQAIDMASGSLTPDQRSWLQQRLLSIDQRAGFIFNDNLSNLEQLQIRKAEHYRDVLLSWFGPELLLR
ncbi:MAG: hypothetical protein Kow0065_22320 [Methylomicrobium sp.]